MAASDIQRRLDDADVRMRVVLLRLLGRM